MGNKTVSFIELIFVKKKNVKIRLNRNFCGNNIATKDTIIKRI